MMKSVGPRLAAGLVFLAAVTSAYADETPRDAEPVVGEWTVVGGERDGGKKLGDEVLNAPVVIRNGTITVRDRENAWVLEYRLDSSTAPKTVWVKPTGGTFKGKEARGIYRRDGDRLTIAYGLPGEPPP